MDEGRSIAHLRDKKATYATFYVLICNWLSQCRPTSGYPAQPREPSKYRKIL